MLKYEVVEVNKVEVLADVSMLRKKEELWFNATAVARQYGKEAYDFLRLDSTNEFIEAILKPGFPGIKTIDDLVIVKKGKYGGTWLHKELYLEFAGWCSAEFRLHMYKWIEQRCDEERLWQQKRLEAKTGYLPMTEAIEQAHDDPKFYHYVNEADLINRIITGMSAKQFKSTHKVDDVRDALTQAQLNIMKKLQAANASLIELDIPYEQRKFKLEYLYEKQVLLLT